MQKTAFPHVNHLIQQLLDGFQTALPGNLIGIYLFGSLVTGDFDEDTSDVDLLIVTGELLTESEFKAIQAILTALRADYPEWKDRIEAIFAPQSALRTLELDTIAITSPGEAFHYRVVNRDWILNWYVVQEKGQALVGPPPNTIIAPITFEVFASVVKEHLRWWETWLETSDTANHGSQAYAILTMCRALYTLQVRDQGSKLEAARWASSRYPQWASLLENSLLWRKALWHEEDVDHSLTIADTQAFIRFALTEIFG
jgi:hypothetical protein